MIIDTVFIDKGIVNTQYTTTNAILKLKNQLFPGDSAEVYVKWHFKIYEKRNIRMGNYGNDRFFIAYWYPQIAVYDDIDGWDLNEYTGTTEFYNDFNNFDVEIKVPDGFMVWACGDLQNIEKHYSSQVVAKYNESWNSDEVVEIINEDTRKHKKVFAKNASNTWQFVADYVPDFTFAAARNYNWDARSLVVDSASMRRVFVDAVYGDNSRTFHKAADLSAKSLEIMSFQLPGVPFPYEHMTSFSNGRRSGGMESPMMANNGDHSDILQTAGLLFHENLHSYFPFYMGTNERKYAWMDEGWAAYMTYQMMEEFEEGNNYMELLSAKFQNINGLEKEVSLMTLSYNITNYAAYRVHAYNRGALAYHYLKDALGDTVFKEALHEYMFRWQGRHPTPFDFFATFSDKSGIDLNWFFIPWFFETAVADMGIKKLTNDNQIIIENYGGLPLPIKLKVSYMDGSEEDIYKSTMIWSIGNKAVVIDANKEKQIKSVNLGDNIIPDINKINNIFAVKTTEE